ncbi:MAG: response regulator transcription factor [Chloroflexi bacterium]|nr:response regulator transcription factor [Chloroflexota bacterium]
MTVKSYILVVDDEDTIREVVRRYLEHEGYVVKEAADGYEALDFIQDTPPTLIVLDLMLPGIDGLSLTQHLRQDREIPIIMLTAKSEPGDRIRGLDLGADDYITKPFNPQELVSRVRAVLRRIGSPKISTTQQPIQYGTLSIDPVARNVEIESQSIALTAKEFDLLWHFAQHPQQVFTRSQLLTQVWGDKLYTDPSTVTVHIRRLREKIEINASQPDHIQTVWGVGYKFLGDK